MAEDSNRLFEEDHLDNVNNISNDTFATGILPSQVIRNLINQKKIISMESPIEEKQIQPASIDLRLGSKGYRVQTSFLPGENNTVQQKIERSIRMLQEQASNSSKKVSGWRNFARNAYDTGKSLFFRKKL